MRHEADSSRNDRRTNFTYLGDVRVHIAVENLHSTSQSTGVRQTSSTDDNEGSSRSSKVINLGVNQKRTYNFLLVINSNFGRIPYSFLDIDV